MSYLFSIARERDHFARERDLFARERDLFAFPRHNITYVLSGAPCIHKTQYTVHSTQNLMQPFSDTRDVEQRETSLLTVAKQRDDVPPISIYLFECVRPINVISISFIYIMYNCDAGCQGGMKNQSVAMQQDLYGSEHSLANESFDFTLMKRLFACSQKCPRGKREDSYAS